MDFYSVSLCWLDVALPLLAPPSGCRIASRRPLIAPLSCCLVEPAGCCIASCRPLVAPAGCCMRRLLTRHPLIVLAVCRIIISCRPLVAPPSCPLIVLAGCCVAYPMLPLPLNDIFIVYRH